MTKDVISLSISVLLLFRHYMSHKITFGAPSSGGVLCSACGAFILLSDEPTGLQNSLGFVTGLDTIPSLGFDPSPRLRFHHPSAVDGYGGLPYMPYTNACVNILTVPVLSYYDFFKE